MQSFAIEFGAEKSFYECPGSSWHMVFGSSQFPAKAGSNSIKAAIQKPTQIKKLLTSVTSVFIGRSSGFVVTHLRSASARPRLGPFNFNSLHGFKHEHCVRISPRDVCAETQQAI